MLVRAAARSACNQQPGGTKQHEGPPRSPTEAEVDLVVLAGGACASAGAILVDKAAEDAEEANHHRLVPNQQTAIRDGRRRQMDLAAKEQPATRQPSQAKEEAG